MRGQRSRNGMVRDIWDVKRLNLTANTRVQGLPVYRPLQSFFQDTPSNILTQVLNIACGVEIEIENCRVPVDHDGWEVKTDGSLRNNGAEFITKLGLRIHHLFGLLPKLIEEMKKANYECSDRTSLHVHINAQNMIVDQLNAWVLLYVMFEEALFRYTSLPRRHNIFCVPLLNTMQKSHSIYDLVNHSNKYCALNLMAIKTFGTLEFRHLDMVLDATHILGWLMLLGFMKRAAAHNSLEDIIQLILQVQTESHYDLFVKKIFYGFSPLLPWKPQDIDKASSDAKLLMFEGEM